MHFVVSSCFMRCSFDVESNSNEENVCGTGPAVCISHNKVQGTKLKCALTSSLRATGFRSCQTHQQILDAQQPHALSFPPLLSKFYLSK
jgi:hypothetical protein